MLMVGYRKWRLIVIPALVAGIYRAASSRACG